MAKSGLQGVEQMRAKLKRLARNIPLEAMRAGYMEFSVEHKEIIRRTPVDKGPLRASIHLKEPVMRGNTITIEIVAGGIAAPYALIVHEDLSAFHKVGQAKYMESVLMESRPYLAQRIARRIELNRALGG